MFKFAEAGGGLIVTKLTNFETAPMEPTNIHNEPAFGDGRLGVNTEGAPT